MNFAILKTVQNKTFTFMRLFLISLALIAFGLGIVYFLPQYGKKIRDAENFFLNPQKKDAERKINQESKALSGDDKNSILVDSLKASEQKLLLDTAIENGYSNPLELYLNK